MLKPTAAPSLFLALTLDPPPVPRERPRGPVKAPRADSRKPRKEARPEPPDCDFCVARVPHPAHAF